MAHPIIYVDHSEIRLGKRNELKLAIKQLVELIESNEPQLVAYQVFFSEDATRMSVVHVHRDSESLRLHMKVAGPAFARFVELVTLQSIDLYGSPSRDLLEQLREKARLLGGGTVRVHGHHAGFSRFDVH